MVRPAHRRAARRPARLLRQDVAQAREVTAREAVAFAVEHCFEQYSVVPERELLRVALLHGMGSVTLEQIAAELPRHGVFVEEIDGRRMATTEALQAEEDDIARFAATRAVTLPPVGVANGLDRTLEDGKRLSGEQWQAVTGLLESEDRVNLLEGPAGAGKSSLAGQVRRGDAAKGAKRDLSRHHRQGGRGAARRRFRGGYRRPLPGR